MPLQGFGFLFGFRLKPKVAVPLPVPKWVAVVEGALVRGGF